MQHSKSLVHLFAILLGTVLLSLLHVSSAELSDFVSCSGFVGASVDLKNQLTQKQDFSFIQVQLVTNQGVVKEASECAPNGFFMIPIYDLGDFKLQVQGPEGWNFEPKSIPLSIENGKCNEGENINFVFTGFSIYGKIQSEGCAVDSINQVSVQLFDSTGKLVASTKSNASGTYSFSNVIPGEYTIKAVHQLLSFSKDSLPVVVEWGNSNVEEDIEISGYTISGKILSVEQEPIENVDVDLYLQENPSKAIQSTKSDNKGSFLFRQVPCGSYNLIPTLRGEGTTYDISPSSSSFQITGDKDIVELGAFQVVGFSVRGVVTDKKDSGIGGVSVYVDGAKQAETRPDGTFTWEKASSGDYKIEFKKENYFFPTLNKVHIAPKSASLPPVQVDSFGLCGKLEFDSSSLDETQPLTIQLSGGKTILSSPVTSNGEFCFQVSPGTYELAPVLSSQKESGEAALLFEPPLRSVVVENAPVVDLAFSQIKVEVHGKIHCLESVCPPNLQVTLTKAQAPRSGKNVAIRAIQTGNDFLFPVVYPGSYSLKIDHPSWCWESASQFVTVARGNVDVASFVQTGYKLEIQSSKEIQVESTHLFSSKQETFDLKSGGNHLCLTAPGEYELKPKSCYKFPQEKWKIDTKESTLSKIEFQPTHVKVEGKITLQQVTSFPEKISLTLQSSTAHSSVSEIHALKLTTSPEGTPQEYAYEYWATPGESLTLSPVPQSPVLFYPKSASISTGQGFECAPAGPSFTGRPGQYLRGTIQPTLAQVEITVRAKPSATRGGKGVDTATGEIVTRVFSDANGLYEAGPLYDDVEYLSSAYLEGYHFSGPHDGNFVAVELKQFTVDVRDESGNPVAGVILTLTGQDAFHNVSRSDQNGRCSFGELFPGEYYLKPALKEYLFSPASLRVHISQEKGSHSERFVAERVAFSCFGHVRSLNGDSENSAIVFAVLADELARGVDQSQWSFYEETQTDKTGAYRIRGLKPGAEYAIQVKTTAKFDHASPEFQIRPVAQEDLFDVDFIAFRSFAKFDIFGTVSSPSEFLSTLSVELHVQNKRQNKEELLKTYQLGPSNFFDFPLLPNEEYSLKLKTTLNSNQYDFDLDERTINLGELLTQNQLPNNRYFVSLSFNPKLHLIPAEIANVSFYPLVIISIIVLGYWYRAPLLRRWNPQVRASRGWDKNVNKPKQN